MINNNSVQARVLIPASDSASHGVNHSEGRQNTNRPKRSSNHRNATTGIGHPRCVTEEEETSGNGVESETFRRRQD